MKAKATFVVCMLLAIAAGSLTVVGVRPTPAADAPRVATPEAGRYQVLQDKNGEPRYLFDPATGQVWSASFAAEKGEWVEHIDPPKKK